MVRTYIRTVSTAMEVMANVFICRYTWSNQCDSFGETSHQFLFFIFFCESVFARKFLPETRTDNVPFFGFVYGVNADFYHANMSRDRPATAKLRDYSLLCMSIYGKVTQLKRVFSPQKARNDCRKRHTEWATTPAIPSPASIDNPRKETYWKKRIYAVSNFAQLNK